VSNLSTYVACALAAVLVMDHASILPSPRAAIEFLTPDEIADPGTAINRALKGDRWAPALPRRESRPAEAPLEVVDFPTGGTRKRESALPPSPLMNNVTAIVKRPSPLPDRPPIQQKLPWGCESAFGRLVAPPLARVPGRCII
jgi:hypothetical protein